MFVISLVCDAVDLILHLPPGQADVLLLCQPRADSESEDVDGSHLGGGQVDLSRFVDFLVQFFIHEV